MKPLIIYHKADLDGQWSGYLASLYHKHEVELYPWDYGDPIPVVEPGRRVDMLDVSFPRKDMDRLNIDTQFHWIDHHDTAIREMEGLAILGRREVGKAACELAWDYYFGPDLSSSLIHHVGRYDVWDKSDPASEQIQYGLRTYNLDLTKNRACFDAALNKPIDEIASIGKIILDYVQQTKAYTAKEKSFEIALPTGTTFICLNTASKGSINLLSVYDPDKHNAMLIYGYDGLKWNFSLYSTGYFHCGSFCQQYGGGGHKGAAGFRLAELPDWLNNNNNQ